MKVLFVNRENAFTRLGGDTVQMVETKESLKKLGVQVDIALGVQDESTYSKYDIIHVFNIQTEDFTLEECKKIKKCNKRLYVSTIWWDFSTNHINLNLNLNKLSTKDKIAKAILGKKLYVKLKENRSKKFNSKRFEKIKEILDLADILLPNSKMELDSLNNNFNNDYSKKSYVVYNGINLEKYCGKEEMPKELKDNSFKSREYVLQVGRIEDIKGTLETIKACNEFNLPLVIVGKAADDSYMQLCEEEAKNGKVYFAGLKNTDELVPFYRNARVHALPSLRETPGLVSIEAGYCGCQIVSTIEGSTKEYFKDLVYYCDPVKYDSIRDGIYNAWYNGKDINALKSLIKDEYNWDNAASQTLKAYNVISE
ncbi:glycosyltransferase family 4 protein [Clostridium celatum]|uniref:glycosyltransferase family 4 protein n=1 Tax=Clostridium celatum TaxID=36834 RepID=UPI001896F7FC|nr:glycosyltransferase family 4 protein [Clostridium celatum]